MDLLNILEDIRPTYPKKRKGKKPKLVQFHQAIFLKMKKSLKRTFQTKNSQLKCLKMSLTRLDDGGIQQFTLKMTSSNKALDSKLNKLSSEFQIFKGGKNNEKKDLDNSLNFIQSQYDNLMAKKETLAALVA